MTRAYRAAVTTDYTPPATTVRVYGAKVAAAQQPTVEAGLDKLNVEPGEQVTFTATSPNSPDTWTWRQVSGPTATFTQDGASVTVTAPYTLNGGTIVLGVTCTKNGIVSAEDTVQVGVMYATLLAATSSGWVPVEVTAV